MSPWIYLIAFAGLAGICWRIGRAQRSLIRGLRDELAAEVAIRKRLEIDLGQAQKLEAVGRLAAGVAHEINTPMQFIGDSIRFVDESIADLFAVRKLFVKARAAAPDEAEAAYREATAREEELDMPYITEHVPKAIALAAEGCQRVAAIVRSMKQISHSDPLAVAPADLNAAIAATVVISGHQCKLVADVEQCLATLPPVPCNVGELNQVLLNLIMNAVHAIEDAHRTTGKRGQITLTSRLDGDHAVISVADDGTGIPVHARARLFEPFFTTKAAGRGTGQGLSISRSLLERRGGELTYETELGRGTTFHIRLPLSPTTARHAA